MRKKEMSRNVRRRKMVSRRLVRRKEGVEMIGLILHVVIMKSVGL